MELWQPFETEALYRVLKVDRAATFDYLFVKRRSLNQLAEERGIPRGGLGRRLVRASSDYRSQSTEHMLVARAERVLNQPHLADHMLHHIFHTWSVFRYERVFGLPKPRFNDLFRRGVSYNEIAAAGGLALPDFRSRVISAFDTGQRKGLRLGRVSWHKYKRTKTEAGRFFGEWADWRLPRARPHAKVAVAVGAATSRRGQLVCQLGGL